MKIKLTQKVVIIIMTVVFGIVLGLEAVEQAKMKELGCKETGQQRMVNTIDGVAVQDQFKCRNGEVIWRLSYK